MRRLLAVPLAALLVGAAACTGDRTFAPDGAPPALRPDGYTATELAYFDDITLGGVKPQFTGDGHVHKWTHDVRVVLLDAATAADAALADTLCAQITAAIGGPVRVARDTSGVVDIGVDIGPRRGVLDGYTPEYGQLLGIAIPTLDAGGAMLRARIFIDADLIAGERRFILRHELLHALGFPEHSHVVPGATLYNVYDPRPAFFDVDLAALEMLYRDEVRVGMTSYDAISTLKALPRRH